MSRLRRFQARTDARRSGGKKVKCQGQAAQAAQASGGLAFSRNNSRSGFRNRLTASNPENALSLTFLKQSQSFVSLRSLDIAAIKTRNFHMANTVPREHLSSDILFKHLFFYPTTTSSVISLSDILNVLQYYEQQTSKYCYK
jgi:hypothetical protein